MDYFEGEDMGLAITATWQPVGGVASSGLRPPEFGDGDGNGNGGSFPDRLDVAETGMTEL